MRKFLPVVAIAALFALSFSPVRGQEYSDIDTMQAAGAAGSAGDTLYLPVNLTNTFDVGGFGFRIVYDPDAFRVIDVDTTSRSDGFEWFGADTTVAGIVRFIASSFHPVENAIPPGEGPVALMTVLIKETAQPGEYDLVFEDSGDDTFENSLTRADDFALVVPILSNGWIDVDFESGTDDPITVPGNLALAANYPNPFNSSTVISFSLEREMRVDLEIFDLLGRKITTLYSGPLGAGDNSFVWDGRSSSGKKQASGIFFYRLSVSGGESLTRRMTLLK